MNALSSAGSSRIKIGRPLRWCTWAAIFGTLAFDLRMVYEQTILTRREGPQMLGFSTAHLFPGLLILGVLALLAGYVCLAAFVLWAIRNRVTGRPGFTRLDWVQCAVLICVLAVPYVPYSAWQLATVEIAGPGRGAVSQLARAASENDRLLVRALLHAGVPVNQPTPYGDTPLNHACVSGAITMARYLISRGARLDDAPNCRQIGEFRAQMKPPPPEPGSGLPKVPGTPIEVHAQDH